MKNCFAVNNTKKQLTYCVALLAANITNSKDVRLPALAEARLEFLVTVTIYVEHYILSHVLQPQKRKYKIDGTGVDFFLWGNRNARR